MRHQIEAEGAAASSSTARERSADDAVVEDVGPRAGIDEDAVRRRRRDAQSRVEDRVPRESVGTGEVRGPQDLHGDDRGGGADPVSSVNLAVVHARGAGRCEAIPMLPIEAAGPPPPPSMRLFIISGAAPE